MQYHRLILLHYYVDHVMMRTTQEHNSNHFIADAATGEPLNGSNPVTSISWHIYYTIADALVLLTT